MIAIVSGGMLPDMVLYLLLFGLNELEFMQMSGKLPICKVLKGVKYQVIQLHSILSLLPSGLNQLVLGFHCKRTQIMWFVIIICCTDKLSVNIE